MGFIVEQHLNYSETHRSVKKDQAVVYGKAQHMWTVSYVFFCDSYCVIVDDENWLNENKLYCFLFE